MLKYIYKPFWRSEAAAAKPKISFLSNFPLRGGGVGEPQIKMIGNFWVLPRASLSSAAEAQVSFVKILRILPEIHSNFVQYTPQTVSSIRYSAVQKALILQGFLAFIHRLKLIPSFFRLDLKNRAAPGDAGLFPKNRQRGLGFAGQ